MLTGSVDRRAATLRGLVFTPELRRIFEGGLRLRDDPEFPGRKYFLAHAARELRRDLHKHVAAYLAIVKTRGKTKHKSTRMLPQTAMRWVAEVSPILESFADSAAPVDRVVQIPRDLAALLDPYMRKEASASASLRGRMRDGYRSLGQFVPVETLEGAVQSMHGMEPDAFTHVRALDEEFSDSEVTTLWDKLEGTLFDLFGANAWTYRSIDVTADMLNRL